MKNSILFFLFVFVIGATSIAQNYAVSGDVRDRSTGESIIGATVLIKNKNSGAVTNNFGFYSITLPTGNYEMELRCVGYETLLAPLKLQSNLHKDFELNSISFTGGPVIIEGTRKDNVGSTEMGKIEIGIEQIKKIPVIFGEVDILKTITLLPGVQSSGEGNAGFYVRGGGVDQNLILLDNSTVYNASHLFGFFSVFNADAVKNIEITKGGGAASYGGRLSSVLDINLKEGNSKSFHGAGGVGTIASRFTVEGPIKKDTSSFILSGRRTYIDILAKPFMNPESSFNGSGYFFYDLNAKFNYRLSNRDQIFASVYTGKDVFSFNSSDAGFSTRIPWGNTTGTIRWAHQSGSKLFMNAILTYTDYNFQFEGKQDQFTFGLSSGIRDYGAKVQWSYFPNPTHRMKWGVDYTFHKFTPNNTYASSGDVDFDLGEQVKLYSHESAAYFQDDFDINEKWRINAGVRIPYFMHVGPFTRYTYPTSTSNVGGSTTPITTIYEKNKKVADYVGFEPRFNARYEINKASSFKMALSRNLQFITLTSLSPSSLPTDVWLPSTDRLKPQLASQVSIGYFRNFFDDSWESSVELYYKDMQNQSDYREGSTPDQTVGDNIDNLLVFGRGYSYGAEFFIKKRMGDFSGWVGYTWAKTMRIFEEVNNGKAYPTRWDRRHDANVVLMYTLSPRVDLGFVFVYATGNAITLPISRYFFEGNLVEVYGERNSFRMAPYHRADFSLNVKGKLTRSRFDAELNQVVEEPRKFRSSWNFSVYNLYNRMNPYFIYFATKDNDNGGFQITARQVSLFPILPSITWNFEF
jgi:hypothetical protein